jgi:chemotaxis-related protein WspD
VHCRNCEVFHLAGRGLLDREPPRDYGVDWASSVADRPSPSQGPTEAVIVFQLNEELLALPAEVVVEIIDSRPIRPIPHRRTDLLLGLVGVRGELRLCVSLEVIFGRSRPDLASPPRGRLIAVGLNDTEWVVPVESVLALTHVSLSALSEVPATLGRSPNAFVRGVFSREGRQVGLLDGELVLDALRRWRSA